MKRIAFSLIGLLAFASAQDATNSETTADWENTEADWVTTEAEWENTEAGDQEAPEWDDEGDWNEDMDEEEFDWNEVIEELASMGFDALYDLLCDKVDNEELQKLCDDADARKEDFLD